MLDHIEALKSCLFLMKMKMIESVSLVVVWTRAELHQDETHVAGDHSGTAPVVEVVVELSITNTKLVVREELVVLHDVECVKHIKAVLCAPRR
jgi:hypothetical protein